MSSNQKIKITLDTTNFVKNDHSKGKLLRFLKSRSAEFDVAWVSTTEREYKKDLNQEWRILELPIWKEGGFLECSWGDKTIPEGMVLGESQLGVGTLVKTESDDFEFTLNVISNGAFPKEGKRSKLTKKQRSQLRDAIIFAAHIRHGRDVFISDDKKAFIGNKNEKRKTLESHFKTQILTLEEFLKKYDK